MNKQIISMAIGTVVALLVSGTSFAQGSEGPVFVPVELYACQYNEGKGPADLDAAAAAWTEYADRNGIDTYAAWTLEKHYHGPDQDYFDVLWLGAWKNANEKYEIEILKQFYKATCLRLTYRGLIISLSNSVGFKEGPIDRFI